VRTPSKFPSKTLNLPTPGRQVRFYQLLVAARQQWLVDALSEALSEVDQQTVKTQVGIHVPSDVQKILASAGLRDEYVFPLPVVLKVKPSLIGYYRLLMGSPQKGFYAGRTGMGRFKSMEELGTISLKQEAALVEVCTAMARPLAELVRQIPKITDRDLRELPLLTFGAQLQGSNNTEIGKAAMKEVFVAIADVVSRYVKERTETRLTIKNASGREVLISLAHDPDVSIQEVEKSSVHNKVAIEVKGGTDVSNAHNRAGEAEKSHSKAKNQQFKDFWTIISKTGIDLRKLRSESQTTTEWFDVSEILARKGKDWDEFRERLSVAVGIPLKRETPFKK
jgi:hypothetical protein